MPPTDLVNHAKLVSTKTPDGSLVTLETVRLGMVVRRGPDWRRTWRDDIHKNQWANPLDKRAGKVRVAGTVVGYTDASSALVGSNSGRAYKWDRIEPESGPAWCVVAWDTGRTSVYPIGGDCGIFSLVRQ